MGFSPLIVAAAIVWGRMMSSPAMEVASRCHIEEDDWVKRDLIWVTR